MQGHMALLNALDDHGPQRCKILGQADAAHDLRQILAAGIPQYPHAILIDRVAFLDPSLDPHCQWQFQHSPKGQHLIFLNNGVLGQRLVAFQTSEAVHRSLDRPPVLATSHRYRINSVHYALIY